MDEVVLAAPSVFADPHIEEAPAASAEQPWGQEEPSPDVDIEESGLDVAERNGSMDAAIQECLSVLRRLPMQRTRRGGDGAGPD
jgi:hypothetical protein